MIMKFVKQRKTFRVCPEFNLQLHFIPYFFGKNKTNSVFWQGSTSLVPNYFFHIILFAAISLKKNSGKFRFFNF